MSLKNKAVSAYLVAGFALLLMFSSCSQLPDHARYIPKDATVVAGINFKSLSKKIAWNAITGSKLFKEMQQRLPQKSENDALSGIEKSGIDFFNTIYLYTKPDKRLANGNRVCLIVPLSDATDFENYIKKLAPGINISLKGDRKESMLYGSMYLGWTKKLLIMTNVIDGGMDQDAAKQAQGADAENAAEMDNAFGVTSENSIISNKPFAKLEKFGHDVSLWVNYDQIFTRYMNESVSEKMGGMSINNTLWKDAIFTCGFDFKAGKITGDVNYYLSEELKEIGEEFGAKPADPDMIERLPKNGLSMLSAWRLSPVALKKTVEKTGMLGLINLGLGAQGLTLDNALDAFTGDMALVINNVSLKNVVETDDLMGEPVSHSTQKPEFDATFALEINKMENFKKIFRVYAAAGDLTQLSANLYTYPVGLKDSIYMLIGDKFVVASNKLKNVNGYNNGDFKKVEMPGQMKSGVTGHPYAMFFDIREMSKKIDAGVVNTPHDSVVLEESKKLLSSILINGGECKDNCMQTHIDINFANETENSIFSLMDYGLKISDADRVVK